MPAAHPMTTPARPLAAAPRWAVALAAGLGVLQLVPALRRRHPRWHRASGLVVWLATAASMAGAIGFLVYVPMLRVDWVLWGRFGGLTQESANLASGTVALLQTLALMACWLAWVGDRDLPAR